MSFWRWPAGLHPPCMTDCDGITLSCRLIAGVVTLPRWLVNCGDPAATGIRARRLKRAISISTAEQVGLRWLTRLELSVEGVFQCEPVLTHPSECFSRSWVGRKSTRPRKPTPARLDKLVMNAPATVPTERILVRDLAFAASAKGRRRCGRTAAKGQGKLAFGRLRWQLSRRVSYMRSSLQGEVCHVTSETHGLQSPKRDDKRHISLDWSGGRCWKNQKRELVARCAQVRALEWILARFVGGPASVPICDSEKPKQTARAYDSKLPGPGCSRTTASHGVRRGCGGDGTVRQLNPWRVKPGKQTDSQSPRGVIARELGHAG